MAGYGSGSATYDHRGTECKDKRHDVCSGCWLGIFYFEGVRQPKVYGSTKGEVQGKITAKLDELDARIVTDDNYTIEMAINDWLATGLKGRSQNTIDAARSITKPLIAPIGSKKLKRLSGTDVTKALEAYASSRPGVICL